jgi:hypothetical protein
MNNTVEKKIRKLNCRKLSKNKQLTKNISVLYTNKDKTKDVIFNDFYDYIFKSNHAICSSEMHLLNAVYNFVLTLSPNDELFNQDEKWCDMRKNVITQAVTSRYLLGLDIAQHLEKYIDVNYLK